MILGWSPQIGDPTPLGWLTVLGYFIAAFASLAASRFDRGPSALWQILSAILLALGINKQLDLQSLLTEIGRAMARSEGWYEQRRTAQFLFVVASVSGLAGAGLLFWKRLRRHRGPVRTAYAGLALLLAFICIRAASFHHVDRFLKASLFGARFNWIFELGGIAIIISAAIRACGHSSPRARK